MPFFSVIVPVFNVENYLNACIDSILSQTYSDFELILVDDGSTDQSVAICDAYCMRDSRVRVIHKANGGVVAARKTGLRESCGKYIIHVDSDDYISSDYLSHFYSVIEETGADIISTEIIAVTEVGKPISKWECALQEGLYEGNRLTGVQAKLLYDFDASFHNVGCLRWNICAKAIKRELAEIMQLAVPDMIRKGEDCAVMIPAVCNANSLYVSKYCGYHYRQIETSMVHTFNPREAASLNALIDHLQGVASVIPKENITAFAAVMLWGQVITAIRSLNSVTEVKAHIEEGYKDVISFVLRGINQSKITIGIKLRMIPIFFRWWRLLWLVYHR